MNSYWRAHMCVGSKITETSESLKICYAFKTNRIFLTSYIDELKWCISSDWVTLCSALLNALLASLVSVHLLAFVLEEDILSSCSNKNVVMLHVICDVKTFERKTRLSLFGESFLSQCMCYLVWVHCCKWPNYDFWISQSSVATALWWGGLNEVTYVKFLWDVATKN